MQKFSNEQQGMSNEQRAASSESSPQSSPLNPQSYPVDPRLLAAMYGMQEEDEIDLLEYWRIIWKKRWLIIGVVCVAAVLAAGYSLTLPNIYRAEVVITPVGEKSGGQMSLGGLGGLASMAGISLGGGGGDVEVNLAVLKSREFLWAFVKENKLKPVLFEGAWDASSKSWRGSEPNQWAVYRRINSMVSISSDMKTGLISVSVECTDAALAAKLANDLVARLNAHLRQEALERSQKTLGYLNDELGRVRVAEMRQALFGLISQEQKRSMLASTQKEYAFRILDTAVAPDMKSKPKRSRIVSLVVLLSGLLAMAGSLIWERFQYRENEGDGMEPHGHKSNL
jgi:uncharacterized protein involved in exopolysaccharide biosynthesis